MTEHDDDVMRGDAIQNDHHRPWLPRWRPIILATNLAATYIDYQNGYQRSRSQASNMVDDMATVTQSKKATTAPGLPTNPVSQNMHYLTTWMRHFQSLSCQIVSVMQINGHCIWSSAGMKGRRETGYSRENPRTSGIVRHDSHLRKSENDPAGNIRLYEYRYKQYQLGVLARALTFHHGAPSSIPGGFTPEFSHVGIVLDDAACRQVFSEYCCLPRSCIPAALHPKVSFHAISARMQGRKETGDPRGNTLTSGIVRYDSPMRKSGGDPAGYPTRLTCQVPKPTAGMLAPLQSCTYFMWTSLRFPLHYTAWSFVPVGALAERLVCRSSSCTDILSPERPQGSELACSVLVVLRVPMGLTFSGDPIILLVESVQEGLENIQQPSSEMCVLFVSQFTGRTFNSSVEKCVFRTLCNALQEPGRRAPKAVSQLAQRALSRALALERHGGNDDSLKVSLHPSTSTYNSESGPISADSSDTEDEAVPIARMKGRGKWEILEKTHRPAVSSGTIPTCENPGVTRPGIESVSPWWEASMLTPSATVAPADVCVTNKLVDWGPRACPNHLSAGQRAP
ncbi:hypothetical protein PR048_025122 [Dryococelus australis]|uniref:Uncharacterized protein n=1 Tax=Dryococelus australis TaxID=614101 RepID=A0ABQ9GQH8_9NEOP|nr:hypothetical protein PR048_025122 [Dryococelus australis]